MAASYLAQLESTSTARTAALGARLAAAARPGDVLALVGPLGAGKTVLVRGFACGAGVADEADVCSPTFVLINEYAGRWPLYHADAYRLGGSRELEALGFDELCKAGGVVIVEWADRVADAMPAHAVWIDLEPRGENERVIRLRAGGEAARYSGAFTDG